MSSEIDQILLSDEEYQKLLKDIGVWSSDIFCFLYDMWEIEAQPVKPEYREQWKLVLTSEHDEWDRWREEIGPEWFGDYNESTKEWDWYEFEKFKHITWQQTLTLMGVRKAMLGKSKKFISVVSGHGTGKSASISWILLWYLFCFYGSQIAATAPTANQMNDVLWKECSLWINRMRRREVKDLYDWQNGHIRITVSPESWFARAKTATKENPEALAGIHAEHVLLLADEASGISEQIFNTAEGALTSSDTLFIMISNGTRTTGYFYDSHHKNKDQWQTFAYDGEQSPIVDKAYVDRQERRHGRGTDEFIIRVSGGFPRVDAMDDSGYYQLTPSSKVTIKPYISEEEIYWFGRVILGVDPSGMGKDKASFVLRDRFKAMCIKELQTTNPRQIAEFILHMIDKYKIKDQDVVIDGFGIGADVSKEVAVASRGKYNCYSVLVGNKPAEEERYNAHLFKRLPDEIDDPTKKRENQKDLYLNVRALMHARVSKWCIQGGEILDHNGENSTFKEEIASIRAKRTLQGNTIQLMPKKEAQKLRIPSPNKADALALTFLRNLDDDMILQNPYETGEEHIDDPYALL